MYVRILLVALMLVGCYRPRVLIPSPAAQKDGEFSASVEVEGVRLVAKGNWYGEPTTLTEVVTPVQIFISNQSGIPLRLRYKEFSLGTRDNGFVSNAIPPFEINRPGIVAVTPAFPYSNFYLAPQYMPFYPSLTPWPGDFAWAPYDYDAYVANWRAALPTNDMLQKALPEGVLESGGSIRGFVYFQRLGFPEGTSVYLDFDLVNAKTGQRFGTATIPFIIEKD